MDQRELLISCFGLGVVAQVVLLLNRNISFFKLAGCAAFALVAMLPGKHEQVYEPLFHVLMALSFFSFMVAFVFQEEILPTISEALLLSYTIVFWFAFFSYYYHGTGFQKALVIIAALPTALTLYMTVDNENPGSLLKLIMYTWFLTIIVCLGIFQFPFSDLALFYKERQVPWLSPFESFASGMAFMFLVANATYIFYLIPIPGRSQSWKSRMEDWRNFSDMLIQRFSNAQIPPLHAFIILIGEIAILFFNTVYHWLPTELIINLAIVLPGTLLQLFGAPTAMNRYSGTLVARGSRLRHLAKDQYRRK